MAHGPRWTVTGRLQPTSNHCDWRRGLRPPVSGI
jgi:hypothetical protein